MQPTPPVKSDNPYASSAMGTQPMAGGAATSSSLIASVSGRRVYSKWGTLTPAFFGSTTVELHHDRVVEYTEGIVAKRECHAPISDVDSVEIAYQGNPVWLALGIATLALFGLGIIFLILFFIIKYRFLVIYTQSNALALSLSGNEEQYRAFLFRVMEQANRYKLSGG